MREMQKRPVKCVTSEDQEYPAKLRKFTGMPKKLYYIGNLPDSARPSAAVVGARMCSPYGRIQAFKYARKMAEYGVQIISGLAKGIDEEGHKGALDAGTPTFAVLGSGVDVCYPASNRRLYERILETGGGILSEQPPGTPPKNWAFPARNRIISALSDTVLVVEAKEKSGSLITAGFALEQGNSVYAVPGAVNEELSRGCNKLIFDGAGIAYCPEIMLMEWGLLVEPAVEKSEKKKLGLAPDLDLVYSCLDLRPENPDVLIEKTGLPAAKVCALLTELELMGLVKKAGLQYYRIP